MKSKRYQCKQCGREKMISTNHYGECYSLGDYNACPNYHLMPPNPKHPQAIVRKVTIWICLETPPSEEIEYQEQLKEQREGFAKARSIANPDGTIK